MVCWFHEPKGHANEKIIEPIRWFSNEPMFDYQKETLEVRVVKPQWYNRIITKTDKSMDPLGHHNCQVHRVWKQESWHEEHHFQKTWNHGIHGKPWGGMSMNEHEWAIQVETSKVEKMSRENELSPTSPNETFSGLSGWSWWKWRDVKRLANG